MSCGEAAALNHWRGAWLCVHSRVMAKRPCKADTDLKRIWQLLLPDTPLPACGAQENAGADAGENAPPPRDDAETRPAFPHARRN